MYPICSGPSEDQWDPASPTFCFFFLTDIQIPFFGRASYLWKNPNLKICFYSVSKGKTVSCGELPAGRTCETF